MNYWKVKRSIIFFLLVITIEEVMQQFSNTFP